ncbi:TPA: outer membrane protein assembly factor BamE [Shewanella algae]|uniref:outer membrane protein assembly factor BamE domain-containing protein n=1 Tax=Shewanella algae TaxID=38313 RepID=UPI001C5887E2|nr:outer membrane protein assembly factor BamE [Shewanella algae]HDS1203086.1 outer membrane protein assembly factor BamE [Shewanella algae]
MKKLIFILIVAMAGCVSRGVKITEADINSIVVGTTTEASLVSKFGKPLVKGKDSDGNTNLSWYYVKSNFVGGYEQTTLTVTFGPDGKVKNYLTSGTGN